MLTINLKLTSGDKFDESDTLIQHAGSVFFITYILKRSSPIYFLSHDIITFGCNKNVTSEMRRQRKRVENPFLHRRATPFIDRHFSQNKNLLYTSSIITS